MKKVVFIAFIVTALFVAASPVHAETCVTQYGGGVVCGASTPEITHEPVKAGIGDINFATLAAGAFISSVAAFAYSKKLLK